MMEQLKSYKVHLLVLVVLLHLAACTTFFLHGNSIRLWGYNINLLQWLDKENSQEDLTTSVLHHILKNAAMENRTVIITTINEAWAKPNSIFDLFLESFRVGEGTLPLLNHLVVLAVDQMAMNRCMSMNLHCHLLTIKGLDSPDLEQRFMTRKYFIWMWERTRLLGKVLELGYSFVLTDVDIVWFRTPFPQLSADDDFSIACDYFNGNTYDLKNRVNGGYFYVRSNNRTISFFKHWYEARRLFPLLSEQGVLDEIKEREFVRSLGLKMRFLDTNVFGGICQHGEDLNKLCTLHANCCLGMPEKIADLKMVLEVWRRFTSLPKDQKARGISWKTRCQFKFWSA